MNFQGYPHPMTANIPTLLHTIKMPQSGVGSMQGSNEDCLPMKGHTQGGDTSTM